MFKQCCILNYVKTKYKQIGEFMNNFKKYLNRNLKISMKIYNTLAVLKDYCNCMQEYEQIANLTPIIYFLTKHITHNIKNRCNFLIFRSNKRNIFHKLLQKLNTEFPKQLIPLQVFHKQYT